MSRGPWVYAHGQFGYAAGIINNIMVRPMRLLASILFSIFALSLTLTPVVASASADKADELARIETRGLKSAGAKRLNALIRENTAASKPAVQFSRDWIDTQPKVEGAAEWQCLAEALYFEARGETVRGQFAVAEVIRNRVKSARFPGSYCGVINQGTGKKYQCQFTYTCDGNKEVIAEPAAFARVGKVARLMLDGAVPALTDGATHYHTNAVNPRWSRVYTKTASIGVHQFYRHTWQTASN